MRIKLKFNKLLKILKKASLLFVFAVPLVHLIYNICLWNNFNSSLANKYLFDVGIIKNDNNQKLKLSIVLGDIFKPQNNNLTVNYDVILISCTYNPIHISEKVISFESNLLLRSALNAILAEKNDSIRKIFLGEIIHSMHDNKDYILFFFKDSLENIENQKEYLSRELVKVYLWDTPIKSDFYRNSRIEKIGIVPLFSRDALTNNGSSEIREKLALNLETSVYKFFTQIALSHNKHINTIGIPAIAGSENRLDSCNYLTYSECFKTLYWTIKKVPHYGYIDKVYFVVWDKLSFYNPPELKSALKGIFPVIEDIRYKKWAVLRQRLIWPIAIIIPFLLTYINILQVAKSGDRRNLIAKAVGAIGFVLAICLSLEWFSDILKEYFSLWGTHITLIFEFVAAIIALVIITWQNKFKVFKRDLSAK